MLLSRFTERREIVAHDGCRLRELLHPLRDPCDLPFSLARARIEPGQATHSHRLLEETEVYYFLAGAGRMHVDRTTRDVQAGDAVVVPAGTRQWVECVGPAPLEFLNIVSPPWRADHDVRCDGARC